MGPGCRGLRSSCSGKPVSGNPISYYNGTRWTFGWEDGRKLISASSTGNTISYGYDLNGVRDSKTVNGVEHTYYYASGKLLRETYGTNTLDFIYDSNGNPYALKYNGNTYYYITNLQGDVMYMVDANGATVATYEYDPYGKVTKATGAMASINPLRYRGYYYDVETGFYYLQSRYYDPEICRFINADGLASTGQGFVGQNMFAYCLNDPVRLVDSHGSSAEDGISATIDVSNNGITITVEGTQTYKICYGNQIISITITVDFEIHLDVSTPIAADYADVSFNGNELTISAGDIGCLTYKFEHPTLQQVNSKRKFVGDNAEMTVFSLDDCKLRVGLTKVKFVYAFETDDTSGKIKIAVDRGFFDHTMKCFARKADDILGAGAAMAGGSGFGGGDCGVGIGRFFVLGSGSHASVSNMYFGSR